MVHGFDSISIAQFPAMICSDLLSFSIKLPQSCSAFDLDVSSFDFEWMILFILCAFDACLTLIWVREGGGSNFPPVGFPLITHKR